MKFCPDCGASITRKAKCTCNSSNENVTINENSNSEEFLNSSFPFQKEVYYKQGVIRDRIAHPQWGISPNREGNYWVVIKNKSDTNTYDDRIGEDGLYRYTGQGLSGDQSFDNSNNSGLRDAESNGQEIHLFWQDNQNSDHKYIGKIKVVKVDDGGEKQRGKDGHLRKVIVFTLEPA